jgi:hypothetical protein
MSASFAKVESVLEFRLSSANRTPGSFEEMKETLEQFRERAMTMGGSELLGESVMMFSVQAKVEDEVLARNEI